MSFFRCFFAVLCTFALLVVSSPFAIADELMAPVAVGGTPEAVAVDAVANRIYVADSAAAKIYAINGSTHAIEQTFSPDEPCQILAVDPVRHRIYAAQNGTSYVFYAFAPDGTRLASVPVGGPISAIAPNSNTGDTYVLIGATSEFEVYSPTFVKRTLALTATNPTLMAVNPATGIVYIGDTGTQAIYRVDPGSFGVVSDAITSAISCVAVDSAADLVYVTVPGDLGVRIYKGDLSAFTAVPLGSMPGSVVCNPATNRAYVAVPDAAGLRVIDGPLAKVIANVPGAPGASFMVLNASTDKIYVPDAAFIHVVDGVALTVQDLATGAAPKGFAVNPITDRLYVTGVNAGAVTPVDGATLREVSVQIAGTDYRRVAVDPQRERVFAGGATGVVMFDAQTNEGLLPLYTGNAVNNLAADPPRNRVFAAGPDGAGGSYLRTINPELPNLGFNIPLTGTLDAGALCFDESLGQGYVVTKITNPASLRVNLITAAGFVQGFVTLTDPSLDVTLPVTCAINPAAHKLYVTNGYTLFTYDPLRTAPNITATVLEANGSAAPGAPHLLAVDSIRNVVYALAFGSAVSTGTLHIVPGNGGPRSSVSVGLGASAVAVDEVAGKVYVANRLDQTVSIIDTATNAKNTLPLPPAFNPLAIAVDPASGKAYVAAANGEVRVIKAGALSSELATVAGTPGNFAVSPRTGGVYVGNATSNRVLAISTKTLAESGLVSFVGALPQDEVIVGSPTITAIGALSLYGPEPVPARHVFYQFDSTAGLWREPFSTGSASGLVGFSELGMGYHTLYTFAADGQEAGVGSTVHGNTTVTGQVNSYRFLVRPGRIGFPFGDLTVTDIAGAVAITVMRDFDTPASVDYTTRGGSAIAGTNFVATSGTLNFASGERSKTVSVPVIDVADGPLAVFFELDLSNPSEGAALLGIGSQHVFILDAQSPDLSLSRREQIAPELPPAATGSLTVTLSPPPANGQWRLFGELDWRNSGDSVAGLIAANYSIEFKEVPNFAAPALLTIPVGEGEAVTASGTYDDDGQTATPGALSVILAPGGMGGWRLQGEQAYRLSGAQASDLNPGRYIVEFQPVTGRATPPKRIVQVTDAALTQVTVTYFIAEPTEGAAPLEFFDASSAQFSTSARFIGQIQTDAGMGTGFVPLDRVVATCAHVLFDDGTLSYVPGVRWFFQRFREQFETPPQIPRGTYLFEGYAAQRTADNSPGESTAESRRLDVAAMYFFEPAARGGASGYLASDAETNAWLTSATRLKTLSGYPVEGVPDSSVGTPFATPFFSAALTNVSGPLFRTTAVHGLPGMSGGPLFARFDDGTFYPAALYLGGSQQAVVRAIDSEVIDIFNRAQFSGNGGSNNVGGGITLVNNGLSGTTSVAFGSVRVALAPAGVNAAGARWRIAPQNTLRKSQQPALGVSPGSYTVKFSPVNGYDTPADQTVNVTAGQEIATQAVYVPSAPPTITSAAAARGITGQAFSYKITATFDPSGFGATGLPTGLSFNPNTGVIAGKPTQSGVFGVQLTAMNAAGTGTRSLAITISAPGELVVSKVGEGTVPKYTGTTTQAVGSLLTVKARPAKNFLFESWTNAETNAVLSTQTTYQFTMPSRLELKAAFVPNLFVGGKGTYLGLLRGSTRELSGLLKLTLLPTGTFTAHLELGGSAATISNVFNVRGHFETVISLADARSYLLKLDLGSAQVTGSLTDPLAGPPIPITAPRSATSVAKALVGSYTAKLTPGAQEPGQPEGLGAVRLIVAKNGKVTLLGTLGSGTPVSSGSSLAANGAWPFYFAGPGGDEIILGTLTPDTAAKPVFSGALDWFRAPGPDSEPYPAGFSTTAQFTSSRFSPPAARYPGATLTFAGAGLAEVVVPFTLSSRGQGTATGLTFSLQTATGLFSGTFNDGAADRPFRGVVFQLDETGAGSFTRANGETGRATLVKTP